MKNLIRIDRTVVLSQDYLLESTLPLSAEQIVAAGRTLCGADMTEMVIQSDTAQICLPGDEVSDNVPRGAMFDVIHSTITIDGEVLELDPCANSLEPHNLDGKLDSLKTCPSSRVGAIKLMVPELFQNSSFLTWLESSKAMTWHQRGSGVPKEDDYADVVIFVDPSLSGEGSDSDMPGHDMVVERIKERFGAGPFTGHHFVVVLSNQTPY